MPQSVSSSESRTTTASMSSSALVVTDYLRELRAQAGWRRARVAATSTSAAARVRAQLAQRPPR
ncbi:hypothetical protein [Conexibacter sp. SYSU D00693]|uniref:hypothetical protein n=1 Tax=Conexibacter sp. SYSU D00693 TaxID=2812560 RepID=UPI00196AC82E|nr:hypothetical protein [Conexibacter sp. SYSU D00693]